jgi:hypothetical protein
MAESRTEQVIEVPVCRDKRHGLNIGSLLIAGGIGYVLFKTFLLEERVNDLTVLLKRRSMESEVRSKGSVDRVTHPTPRQRPEDDEYETSDGDSDYDDDDSSVEGSTHRDDDDADDEVRIEEQPREVPPPAEVPTRKVEVVTPSASAFVTTRQRRSGSESRRDTSRPAPPTREA